MRGYLLIAGLVLFAAMPAFAQEVVVHEWGTFTTLQGSNGEPLSGLYIEEEHLPDFVHHYGGVSPDPTVIGTKGIYRPMFGVTVKMETPVLYFYLPEEGQASIAGDNQPRFSVNVGFDGGAITQWFPRRSGGSEDNGQSTIDFTRGYHGSIEWDVEVLPKSMDVGPTYSAEEASPTWNAPRDVDANLLRDVKGGEIEHYLFYRGIGNFQVPLRVEFNDHGELLLTNNGGENIPFLFVYEKKGNRAPEVWWTGALDGHSAQTVNRPLALGSGRDISADFSAFEEALVQAGLFPKEASAMLKTWHESYFEVPGLKVFWVVPRSLTEDILPINIEPAPRALERVLVGRSEILTPEFEEKLLSDYTNDLMWTWEDDRYRLAYEERIRQLRNASSVSVSHNAVAGMQIYPNPAEERLTIRSNNISGPVTVTISNVLGKEILTLEEENSPEGYRTDIDLAGMPPGLYLLTLRTGDGRQSRTFVKR